VINHLQDCGEDYRSLGRIYVPADALAAAGVGVEALGGTKSSAPLRSVIAALAERTGGLLNAARPLSRRVADLRLGLEIAVIQSLAESLVRRLLHLDPLAQRVTHRPREALGLALLAALRALPFRLATRVASASKPVPGIGNA
jgi:phytoene/squalene synthetase